MGGGHLKLIDDFYTDNKYSFIRRIIASFLSGFVTSGTQETGILAPEELRSQETSGGSAGGHEVARSGSSNVIITKFRSNAVLTVSLSVWLISIILIMNNNHNSKYRD